MGKSGRAGSRKQVLSAAIRTRALAYEQFGQARNCVVDLATVMGDKQQALATRELILDGAGHRGDPERVKAWARDLQGYPGATFQDRILYLEILRQLQDPGFPGYLTDLEKDAVSKPTDLAALLSWMTANGMSLLAINFVHTLPNEELGKWSVPLVIAEAHAKLADWAGLETLVKNGSWGRSISSGAHTFHWLCVNKASLQQRRRR